MSNEGRVESSFVLRLYVAGDSPNSNLACRVVAETCEKYAPGQYLLEIIDVLNELERAQQDGVRIVPALVRVRPLPEQRIAANLLGVDDVRQLLDLP